MKRELRSGSSKTTRIGYINKNGQENLGTFGVDGTDHMQKAYKMLCTLCDHVYGANGTDIHLRKCPACQDGRPGIPYHKRL